MTTWVLGERIRFTGIGLAEGEKPYIAVLAWTDRRAAQSAPNLQPVTVCQGCRADRSRTFRFLPGWCMMS